MDLRFSVKSIKIKNICEVVELQNNPRNPSKNMMVFPQDFLTIVISNLKKTKKTNIKKIALSTNR